MYDPWNMVSERSRTQKATSSGFTSRHALLPRALLYCTLQLLGVFHKWKIVATLYQASLWALLHPQECTGPLCVSVSHFGHSHKISNFPITAIFIPVISDQSL